MYIHKCIYTVSEIAGLASQFATPYCLGCYSKLTLQISRKSCYSSS